jgi:hypothetical protein
MQQGVQVQDISSLNDFTWAFGGDISDCAFALKVASATLMNSSSWQHLVLPSDAEVVVVTTGIYGGSQWGGGAPSVGSSIGNVSYLPRGDDDLSAMKLQDSATGERYAVLFMNIA